MVALLMAFGCSDPEPEPIPVGGDCGFRTVQGELTVTRVEGSQVFYRFDAEGRPGHPIASLLYESEGDATLPCEACVAELGLQPGATLPSATIEVSTSGGGCAPVLGDPFPLDRCACPP